MWTPEDEKVWEELSKKREKTKKERERLDAIESLNSIIKMIQDNEKGPNFNVEVKHIRSPFEDAPDYISSVIGKRLTITYYFAKG